MATVTFVENRSKTVFWSAVADILACRGHTISWIVQNPIEGRVLRNHNVYTLNFPKASDLRDGNIPQSVETDRGRTFFGNGHTHYTYYEAEIDRALSYLQPDVVVGESTLFHELLTIAACQAREIRFLHPTGTRYPGGRMFIFESDTQIPVVGSGETWSEDRVEALADRLIGGGVVPDYMRIPSRMESLVRKVRLLNGQARALLGRIYGERYNTPSLVRKMALSRALRSNLKTWRSLGRAPETGPRAGPAILYPLQMQPEANIEVWGRPYYDQVAVIKRCLAALPANGQVAVKANPKSKYEISKELLELARSDRRIVLLPLDWRMPQAHAVCIGAVTVTGTVGYEAVFGLGRCISLRHPLISEMFPALHADTPEEAVSRLLSDSSSGRGSHEMTLQLLQRVIASSFPGVISEPNYDPTCVLEENLNKVCDALEASFGAIAPNSKNVTTNGSERLRAVHVLENFK